MSSVRNTTAPAEEWIAGGVPITMMMNMERRHGEMKPVIQKALVKLDGAPFKAFAAQRDRWAMETEILTPFVCGAFTKLFSKDEANKCFAEGKVTFFAGGTGHPYFSTDTTTVLRAIEIEAETILLAKAVDGVYDSDPKTNPEAKKYDSVHIQEVIDKKLAVVDLTASILCMENKMPMMVFGLNEENSIVKTARGDFHGTRVLVD